MSQPFADGIDKLIEYYKQSDDWAGQEGKRAKILRDIRAQSVNPEYWIGFAQNLLTVAKKAKKQEDDFRISMMEILSVTPED